MNHSGATSDQRAAVEVSKTRMELTKFCFITLEELPFRLACTEARFFPGGLNVVKNCYSLVARQSLSHQKQCEEEFQSVFRRLEMDHWSKTAYIDLLLKPSEEDLKIWPHSFEFRLRVSLAAEGYLTLISRIRNINCKPFSFSFAYHPYFSISDISEVRIEGLETLDYLDNLFQKERFTEQGDALTFESEVDRAYLRSKDVIAVFDHEKKRTFAVRKEGLPDVVVWNPWEKRSKAIVDLGDEEYKQMLCVNGASIEKPITLKPGEEWTGRLELSVVPSS
ncbi:putative glucose-6-phosphate 1-epimerase [Prunus yedoensis var. nudiflora]|uniref:Putative glucose-6-phosphate 1-epimerase n=1 Tax=Prunus yedoensis var. nudiflora TaxID=2094558 RepID=A0A314ZNI1_PRUYE|nr:putative glucose-6-phosphate 1-epimerase [Prunus yedoensis var. nudiflora]